MGLFDKVKNSSIAEKTKEFQEKQEEKQKQKHEMKLLQEQQQETINEALNELNTYKVNVNLRFRQIYPQYGINKIGLSESRFISKVTKTVEKEIKNGGLTVDQIRGRIFELFTEKYGEPMSVEETNKRHYEQDVKPTEISLEQRFGVPFKNRMWFKCTIEEIKSSTFTNTDNRNVDHAYVFVEDSYLEIIKESMWLKSNMGSRKLFYENIAGIDYDARGKFHMSNGLTIGLKSGKHIQLKNVSEKMVNIVTKTYDDFLQIKNNNNANKDTSNSNVDELMKYAELYEKGLLTKEEFEAKKKELL